VIEVTVSFKNSRDAEPFAHFKQALMLIGRVNQDGFAGLMATHDKNIVVVVTHNNFVNFNCRIRPVQSV
jgi:ABC-type ATPase involved in cell division